MTSKLGTPRLRRLRILLVDGNAADVETLAELFRAEGHIVATAHDGEAALDCFETFCPDVAIMELHLPKLDGFVLVRSARMNVRFQATPMIALCARDLPGDRERTSKLGFAHHFAKPVDLKQLEAVVAEIHAAVVAHETRMIRR